MNLRPLEILSLQGPKAKPTMMQPIIFDVMLFAGPKDKGRSEKVLLMLMGTLVKINIGFLEKYPGTPTLYDSGVLYRIESTENWQDIPTAIRSGWGDCEDLACWRVAELNRAGIKARPYLKLRTMPNGDKRYHALVWLPNGKIEDPSLALGMAKGRLKKPPVYVHP